LHKASIESQPQRVTTLAPHASAGEVHKGFRLFPL
jgi:hypothetical protein